MRAIRRSKEILLLNNAVHQNMLQQIVERDQRDQNRAVAPLLPARDASVLDTSELTIQEACTRALEIVMEYQNAHFGHTMQAAAY